MTNLVIPYNSHIRENKRNELREFFLEETNNVNYDKINILIIHNTHYNQTPITKILEQLDRVSENENICIISTTRTYDFFVPPIKMIYVDKIKQFILNVEYKYDDFAEYDVHQLITEIRQKNITKYNLHRFNNINIVDIR